MNKKCYKAPPISLRVAFPIKYFLIFNTYQKFNFCLNQSCLHSNYHDKSTQNFLTFKASESKEIF